MRVPVRCALVLASTTALAVAVAPAAAGIASRAGIGSHAVHVRAAAPGTITTIAGGVGGPGRATGIGLAQPCGLAFAPGHLYIGQSSLVRALNPATDKLTTPVGIGLLGTESASGFVAPDGTPATAAGLNGACHVAADSRGDLALTSWQTAQVQFVPASSGTYFGQAMTGGDIYVVAGDGQIGFSGDGGPATKARLDDIGAVAFDGSGNVVIADFNRSRIRVVAAATGTSYGQAMTTGDIYTIAGNGSRGFTGDGGPATSAELYEPAAVAFDRSGNLLMAVGTRIRVVAAMTGTFYGQPMAAGDIYTIAGTGRANPLGDGGPATAAGLIPAGIATDPTGNLVVADGYHDRVRLLAVKTGTFFGQPMTAGDIYTIAGSGRHGFAGDGGPATAARLSTLQAIQVDGVGNVLIADTYNNRVRAVAAAPGTFYGRSMRAGRIYTVAGNGTPWFDYVNGGTEAAAPGGASGDSGPATSAQLNLATFSAVRADKFGNILIADAVNNRVRLLAARTGTFYGRHRMAGDVYTIAGDGSPAVAGIRNGVLATKAAVAAPVGVAIGRSGSVLIAVAGQNRVRVLAEHTGLLYGRRMVARDIYTLAGTGVDGAISGRLGNGGPALKAKLSNTSGVSVDHKGNVLISDTGDNQVRVIAESSGRFYGRPMVAGHIYKIAGDNHVATFQPAQVAVDAAGNVLIATNDDLIKVRAVRAGTFYGRRMRPGGLYVIAGGGRELGNGVPARSANTGHVTDLALDRNDNVLFTDAATCRVRVLARRAGMFYDQPMRAVRIYTIAGSGTCGYAGDGGPAVKAALCGPWTLVGSPLYAEAFVGGPSGVTVTPAGAVVIGDCLRIRKIAG
jgi:trimeric autotransporter adhesin